MPQLTTGDWIAAVLAFTAVASFIIDRWRKAVAESKENGAITVRVEGLDRLLNAQMTALTALVERVHHHEIDDADFHGEIRTEVSSVKEQLKGVNARLDGLSAQISRLTPADVFIEVPPGRQRKTT